MFYFCFLVSNFFKCILYKIWKMRLLSASWCSYFCSSKDKMFYHNWMLFIWKVLQLSSFSCPSEYSENAHKSIIFSHDDEFRLFFLFHTNHSIQLALFLEAFVPVLPFFSPVLQQYICFKWAEKIEWVLRCWVVNIHTVIIS